MQLAFEGPKGVSDGSAQVDDRAAMRACIIGILETLDLKLDLRMFGEDRAMPTDRAYGDFWLIGGSGFVVDEKAPQPIVRRVGLVQLTVWQPQGLKSGLPKKLATTLTKGFAGRSLCDLLHRSYQFKKKGELWTVPQGGYIATIGRIGFTRDEYAEGEPDLRLTW